MDRLHDVPNSLQGMKLMVGGNTYITYVTVNLSKNYNGK